MATLKNNTGFSLVEILITLLIIGIVSGRAFLSLPFQNSKSHNTNVLNLQQYLSLLQREALYRKTPILISSQEDQLSFHIWNNILQEWQDDLPTDLPTFYWTKEPKNLFPCNPIIKEHLITFYSSFQRTPFCLQIEWSPSERYQISGKKIGPIVYEKIS